MEFDWGSEPPSGSWAAAHALVTLAGRLTDALPEADSTAGSSAAPAADAAGPAGTAGDSPSAAGDTAGPSADAAAAAGTAADSVSAAGREAALPTEAHPEANQQAYRTKAQPALAELLRTAVAGAVAMARWAMAVLQAVQRSQPAFGVPFDRQERE